jgi:hypothetical protein
MGESKELFNVTALKVRKVCVPCALYQPWRPIDLIGCRSRELSEQYAGIGVIVLN